MADGRERCREIEDDLALAALGLLTGRARAAVLAHVEHCRACATTLEALSRSADRVLEGAPELEPPVGFEVRVFERLGVARPRRRPTARRAALAAVAAAALAAGGVAAGRFLGAASTPGLAPGARLAAFGAAGSGRGEALAAPGALLVAVSNLRAAGYVTCEVTTRDGRAIDVGRFWLGAGAGSAPLPVPVAALASARLLAANGEVLASARFGS